jgi:hypothetical protein
MHSLKISARESKTMECCGKGIEMVKICINWSNKSKKTKLNFVKFRHLNLRVNYRFHTVILFSILFSSDHWISGCDTYWLGGSEMVKKRLELTRYIRPRPLFPYRIPCPSFADLSATRHPEIKQISYVNYEQNEQSCLMLLRCRTVVHTKQSTCAETETVGTPRCNTSVRRPAIATMNIWECL